MLFGYDGQKKAGIGVSIGVIKGGFAEVLVFGFPGTGKSDFPFILVKLLKEELKAEFSLAYVKCDRFAGQMTPKIATKIIDTIKLALNNPPSIIAFDEIETLTLPMDEISPEVAPLAQWLRGLADESQVFNQVLLIGMTNHPKKVDPAVFRRFRVAIYFEVTDHNQVTEIIQEKMDIDGKKAADVSQKLFKQMDTLGLVLLGCRAVDSCKQACIDAKEKGVDFQSMSSAEIVKMMMPNIGPGGLKEALEDWKTKYKGLIDFSINIQIPYFIAIAKRLDESKVKT